MFNDFSFSHLFGQLVEIFMILVDKAQKSHEGEDS